MWTYQNGKLIEQPSMEEPLCWHKYIENGGTKQHLTNTGYYKCVAYKEHIASLRTLPVSPELKLLEGESYEEGIHFKTKWSECEDCNCETLWFGHPSNGCGRLLAIPIDQGIAMTGDFKKEDVASAGHQHGRTADEVAEELIIKWKTEKGLVRWVDMKRGIVAAMEEYKSAPDPTDKTEGAIEILKDLCQLKHYKDEVGKDGFYEREQPLAWKRANEFLNSLPSPPEGEQK